MITALAAAIETYASLSGMTTKEVAVACLDDGVIKRSVMMLLFSVAK